MTFFALAIVGLVVVGGIIFLVRALANRSGAQVAWLLAGALVVGLFLAMFSVRVQHQASPPLVAYPQYGPGQLPPRYEAVYDDYKSRPTEIIVQQPSPTVTESETKASTPDTSGEKTNTKKTDTENTETEKQKKPAWLTLGKQQMPNGNPMFPVSSELFATVTECQRDLDRRLPQLIADEIPVLAAESVVVPLLPGEAQLLTADSFTEEIPLAQGTWYKVHRFIKVDQAAWVGIYNRIQQVLLVERLQTIGLGFGGVMLFLGVVYLFLRRKPRVVDPTLNTFSTT